MAKAKKPLRVAAPNGLNLRREADREGKILAVLRDGEPVEDQAPKLCPEGWKRVKTGDGLEGWVMAEYTREKEEDG